MVYVYHSFLIHLSADGHLGCFHVLALINSAAMNIGVHVSLSDLVSLVCMPRSGIAGSPCFIEEINSEISRGSWKGQDLNSNNLLLSAKLNTVYILIYIELRPVIQSSLNPFQLWYSVVYSSPIISMEIAVLGAG